MKITDYIDKKTVTFNLKAKDKKTAIEELAGLLKNAKKITDLNEATEALLQREKLGSTGIGHGVAIPHARIHSVNNQIAALGISKEGIAFESLDNEPAHIIFLLIGTKRQ